MVADSSLGLGDVAKMFRETTIRRARILRYTKLFVTKVARCWRLLASQRNSGLGFTSH